MNESTNGNDGNNTQYPYQATRHANLVRRNANGVYYVRATVAGKKLFKSTETADEKQAVTKRDEILSNARKLHEAGVVRDKCLSFEAAVALYREELEDRLNKGATRKKNGIQPNTKISYEGALTKILELAKPDQLTRRLDRFSTDELSSWIKSVKENFSATLYNTCTVVFRSIFEIGVSKRVCLINPAEALEHETPGKKTTLPPTPEQWETLVHNIRVNKLNRRANDSADVVEFLTYAGARIEEANHLRKEDVLFERNLIHFREGTTKNGHEKYVPIIPECLPLLKKWILQPRDASNKLLPVGNVNKAIANACKRLKFPHWTQHDFRHLFASRALEITKDVRVVAALLGHQDGGKLLLSTYAHVNASWAQEAASKITFSPKIKTNPPTPPTLDGAENVIIGGRIVSRDYLLQLVSKDQGADKIISIPAADKN